MVAVRDRLRGCGLLAPLWRNGMRSEPLSMLAMNGSVASEQFPYPGTNMLCIAMP